jgi:hypothetical protein
MAPSRIQLRISTLTLHLSYEFTDLVWFKVQAQEEITRLELAAINQLPEGTQSWI